MTKIANKKFKREFPTEFTIFSSLNDWILNKDGFKYLEIGAARLGKLTEVNYNDEPNKEPGISKRLNQTIKIDIDGTVITPEDGIITEIIDNDSIRTQVLKFVRDVVTLTNAVTSRKYIKGDFFKAVKSLK